MSKTGLKVVDSFSIFGFGSKGQHDFSVKNFVKKFSSSSFPKDIVPLN